MKNLNLISSSTAVILVGGKSSRMDFKPKSELIYNGLSFVNNIKNQLSDFKYLLVSVDNTHRFDNIYRNLIVDIYKNAGPLSAIYTSLYYAKTDYIFITACDTPLIKKQLIEYLYEHLSLDDECLICKTSDGKIHPLCGIYKKQLLNNIKQSLESGNRRIMSCLDNIKVKYVDIPKEFEYQLTNVNTPKVYDEIISLQNQ